MIKLSLNPANFKYIFKYKDAKDICRHILFRNIWTLLAIIVIVVAKYCTILAEKWFKKAENS